MKEEKNVVESIAETIKNAVDDKFVLPLSSLQTSSPKSEEINNLFVKEVNAYKSAPPSPCSKANSMKLLKRLARKDFNEFWTTPASEYFPAVSEGTMKLCESIYPHDDAISHAKALISTLSSKELAKDFLYGVSHNAPEYRTALPCYYYIKNLPEHKFQKKFVGSIVEKNGQWKDVYNENKCEICGYSHSLSKEPKYQFWSINIDMNSFYFDAHMPRSSLNEAIIFLEEYKKLPRPEHSSNDYFHFMKIIEIIENTPENMTSGKLRKELKESGLLKMTFDQIEFFINTLGYLDILHSEDSYGMIYTHTSEKDMLHPLSDRGFAEHPVNRWTRKCGIDYKSISMLFHGIYEQC